MDKGRKTIIPRAGPLKSGQREASRMRTAARSWRQLGIAARKSTSKTRKSPQRLTGKEAEEWSRPRVKRAAGHGRLTVCCRCRGGPAAPEAPRREDCRSEKDSKRLLTLLAIDKPSVPEQTLRRNQSRADRSAFLCAHAKSLQSRIESNSLFLLKWEVKAEALRTRFRPFPFFRRRAWRPPRRFPPRAPLETPRSPRSGLWPLRRAPLSRTRSGAR